MKKLITIILLLALCLPAFGQFNDSEPMFGQMLNLGHWSIDGLVFYWRGIEAGNAVDESGNGNHGTITGATWVGDGLDFNGSGDLVDCGLLGTISGAAELTVIICYKPTASNVNKGIIAKYKQATSTDTFFMKADGGGYEFAVKTSARATTFGSNLIIGQTYFLAGVYNGIDVRVYKDGVLDSTPQAQTGTLNVTASPLWIGAYYDSSFTVEAEISDVKIYNRALSASEIQALVIDPGLPMAQDPIWLLFSPEIAPSGIIPIIQAHTRRRRAG